MTDEGPIELFMGDYPPAIRDTGLRLRELVRVAAPEAVEGIRTGWRWIGYGLPHGRRRRTFAWIGPERKHIHLGFENGVLIPDPEHRLEGAREGLRRFRYFTFAPDIDVDEGVLLEFLRAAIDVALLPSEARRSLVEAGAEAVDR